MSGPGRLALRVVVATAELLALIAAPSCALAASPAGETFETNSLLGQQTTLGPFTCNKSGTTTIPFQTSGSAFGPYLGTFSETGTITVGPQTNTTISLTGAGPIVGF